ncbi:hypothetical protein ABZX77_08185 [Streptomyces sp. NPDC004237]|uniref:hypothetical protein n=1 Tax=Streptomyces sp. NPDC004237 TaxID=3154455 RepID=UPI0033B4782D
MLPDGAAVVATGDEPTGPSARDGYAAAVITVDMKPRPAFCGGRAWQPATHGAGPPSPSGAHSMV